MFLRSDWADLTSKILRGSFFLKNIVLIIVVALPSMVFPKNLPSIVFPDEKNLSPSWCLPKNSNGDIDSGSRCTRTDRRYSLEFSLRCQKCTLTFQTACERAGAPRHCRGKSHFCNREGSLFQICRSRRDWRSSTQFTCMVDGGLGTMSGQALSNFFGGRTVDSFPLPETALLSSSAAPFSYKWQKPRHSQNLTTFSPKKSVYLHNETRQSLTDVTENSETISKLSIELENLRAEHRDINEISDQLAAKGQYAGGFHYQLISLKKRKLDLKDRIAALESKLESLLRESLEAEEGKAHQSADPLGLVLSEMMRRLRDLGLKPEQVPPHKDSFFLSLMKGLQRAGLRPNGYDFREEAVMGADRQFPNAAKKARFEVLKLLSSQADKLNPIGGWKLSPEEFQRYFSKAWWTLPAARDDLFMASAHLYSVRIVVFSIEPDSLDEQVFVPYVWLLAGQA